VAKREPKKFKSAEEALVAELGAVFMGEYEELGKFLIEDGDGSSKELLKEAENWLKDTHLQLKDSTLTFNDVVDAVSGAMGIDVRVYGPHTTGPRVEYRFMVTPEGHHKRYHLIGAFVLVPSRGFLGFDPRARMAGDLVSQGSFTFENSGEDSPLGLVALRAFDWLRSQDKISEDAKISIVSISADEVVMDLWNKGGATTRYCAQLKEGAAIGGILEVEIFSIVPPKGDDA